MDQSEVGRSTVARGAQRTPDAPPPGFSASYPPAPSSDSIRARSFSGAVEGAAVAGWSATAERTTIVLLEGGLFAWYAETPPTSVTVNGETRAWGEASGIYSVDCSGSPGAVWVEIEHG